jgi:hypothetical protein
LHGGEGQDNEVILILTGSRKTFRLEYTNDLARHALDADGLADGILIVTRLNVVKRTMLSELRRLLDSVPAAIGWMPSSSKSRRALLWQRRA